MGGVRVRRGGVRSSLLILLLNKDRMFNNLKSLAKLFETEQGGKGVFPENWPA